MWLHRPTLVAQATDEHPEARDHGEEPSQLNQQEVTAYGADDAGLVQVRNQHRNAVGGERVGTGMRQDAEQHAPITQIEQAIDEAAYSRKEKR